MFDDSEVSWLNMPFKGDSAFAQFFTRGGAAKLILDPASGKILAANDAALKFYGYSRAQMQDKYLWDINQTVPREELLRRLAKTVANETAVYQTTHCTAAGQTKSLITFNTPIQVSGRSFVITVIQDVSRLSEVEDALVAAKQNAADVSSRFQRFFEENSAVEMIIDPVSLRIVDVNRAAEEYYGWPRDVLKQKSLTDVNIASQSEIERSNRRLLARGSGYLRVRHRIASGEIRDQEVYVTVIEDNGQKLLFGIVHDITDRLRTEQSLRHSQVTLAQSEDRFRQIFECSSAPELFVSAEDGSILDANEAAATFYGWSRAELLRMNIMQISACEEGDMRSLLKDIVARRRTSMECHHELKSGQIRDVEAYFSPVDIQEKTYIFTIIHDITDRKKAEVSLNLSQRAMDATRNGIVICDARLPDTPIIYVNAGFVAMCGYTPEECLGRNPRFLHRDDLDQPGLAMMRNAVKNGKFAVAEIRNYRKDGTLYWNEVHLSPVRDAKGVITHFLGIQTDVTERKQSEARINYLAFFDPLTELPNRQLFLDRLANAIALAHRTGQYGAIAFIDLDNFKHINEAEGIDAGDQILKEMAGRLQTCLRQEDSQARLGGDEFVVLLPGLGKDMNSAAREAGQVMQRVRGALGEPVLIKDLPHQIGASIGITLFPKGQELAADLLQQADTAMYKAKAAGRNSIAYFEPTMQVAVQERFRLESDLREAVARGDFEMFLQPQVDPVGNLVGAEALIRWRNRQGGLISPAAFIPLAEETGLIVPMGDWMLVKAAEAIQRLSAAGRPIRISVNVSPRQFRVHDFKDRIASILKQTNIRPELLTLEVTEAVIFDSLFDAVKTMSDIKQLGVTFSIDDFGTGYSSLSYLKRMPVSELKIDRSFIQDAPDNANDAALVEAILAVARHHQLHVVAEGVETQEHVEFLKQRGCPLFQGYFFGRPIASEEFLAKLLPTTAGVV